MVPTAAVKISNGLASVILQRYLDRKYPSARPPKLRGFVYEHGALAYHFEVGVPNAAVTYHSGSTRRSCMTAEAESPRLSASAHGGTSWRCGPRPTRTPSTSPSAPRCPTGSHSGRAYGGDPGYDRPHAAPEGCQRRQVTTGMDAWGEHRPHPFETLAAPAIAPQKGEALYLFFLTSNLPQSVDGGKRCRPQPKRAKPVSPAGAPWRRGSPRIAGHQGAQGREDLDF